MIMWNDHHNLEGKHALMGGSNYHWLNWTDDNFEQRFYSQYATDMGTALHQLASDCIKSGTKLNKSDRHLINITLYKAGIPYSAFDTESILLNLMNFVNDSIGFRMSSEVLLYYSNYCFGTTDAIYFSDRERILRISDYKSGTIPAHMEQLMIYAALFCLEYHKHPKDFKIILRIYQNQQIVEDEANPNDIENIMNLIVIRNKQIIEIMERNSR